MPSKASSDSKGKYLRRLPAVGKLMEHPELRNISETCPRVLLVKVIHEVLEAHKARILGAAGRWEADGASKAGTYIRDLSPGSAGEGHT